MTAGQVVLPGAIPTAKTAGSQSDHAVADGFDVQEFVANFDVLAQAEGGIKTLREMVLALAVRGVLVAQEPSEGSSATLLASLEAGRARLSKTSRVRTDLADVASEEVPFNIPSTWRWLRLGHLGSFLGGGTPSKANSTFWDGPIPWVSPKDMKRAYISDAEDHISEAAVEGSAVKLIPTRSLLFVVRGMILAHSFPVALTTKSVTINQDMKALVLAVPATDEYLLRACWAARARVLQRVERSTHGTCRLDTEIVEELPVPLPPLAEQKRIVAKVDELMRLLDDLEAKLTRKREIQKRLRTAALDALTSAEGPDEFEAAWTRVAENFEIVLADAASVKLLRRALRGLAFSGRLLQHEAVWPSEAVEQGALTIVDCPHTTPVWTTTGALCLRTTNFRVEGLDLSEVRYVSRETYVERIARLAPAPGDIVYSREGGILGIACVVPPEPRVCLGQRMMLIRPDAARLAPEFLALMLNAPQTTKTVEELTGGTASPHLNVGDVRKFQVPVPPLVDQRRIVARFNQLMKLCDDLEAKLRRAEETAAKLVEAVVAEMVAA